VLENEGFNNCYHPAESKCIALPQVATEVGIPNTKEASQVPNWGHGATFLEMTQNTRIRDDPMRKSFCVLYDKLEKNSRLSQKLMAL
jgi:hypothetical protein